MKKIMNKFKEINNVDKITLMLSMLIFLCILINAIFLSINDEAKWYGIFIIISLFSIPMTIWSLSASMRDVSCLPELLKIRTKETDKDKKIDAYFDYLEEKDFSLLAPFVALGMFIASFFIYKRSIEGILEWNPEVPLWLFIIFEVFNISYVIYILLNALFTKKIKKIVFSLFITSFIIGSIISSFFYDSTLLILSTSLIIGFNFNNLCSIITKYKKTFKKETTKTTESEA